VGANAPSANRANVRPAIAGAEPELAYWGVYPSGYTPLFLVTASNPFVGKGRHFATPAF